MRISRHGMADAGWRGASGSGRDCTCSGRAGMEKPVKARGMEGSGTVGIVAARQAWHWKTRSGLMWNGMAQFGRSGGEGSGVEWTGLARRILAGMEWVQR